MRIVIVSTILLLACFAANGQADERKDIREGNQLYAEGKYDEAAQKYLEAWKKDDELVEAMYNIGNVYYQKDSLAKAAEMYEAAIKFAEDDKVKAQAFHNLGNTYLKEKKFKEGLDAYKNALKLNPSDLDTKKNLAYAASMLKKQQEEQQQKQQEQPEGENEQEQQQQNDEKKDDENKENKDGPNQQEQESNEQEAKEGQSDEKPKPEDLDKNPDGETQPQEAQLSKEEAERLLEALKQEEQKIQDKLIKARMKKDNSKVEKDW